MLALLKDLKNRYTHLDPSSALLRRFHKRRLIYQYQWHEVSRTRTLYCLLIYHSQWDPY